MMRMKNLRLNVFLMFFVIVVLMLYGGISYASGVGDPIEDPIDETPVHSIKFIPDTGGSLEGVQIFTVEDGSFWDDTITAPTVVPDEGYEFMGWTPTFPDVILESQDFVTVFREVEEEPEEDTRPGRDDEDPTFSIHFVSEIGGTVAESESFYRVDPNAVWADVIVVPEVTVQDGFEFIGWTPSFPAVIVKDFIFTADMEPIETEEDEEDEDPEEEKEPDTVKPEVEYAYMLDGKFYVEIKDEGGLKWNPYTAVLDGEDVDNFKEGFTIDKYPVKLVLEIEDAAGNITEAVFNITMSDQVLEGKVPEKTKAKIEKNQESNVNLFDGFDHIVEGEFNKIINIYDSFRGLILREFGSHNEGDIVITGTTGLTVKEDYSVLLNKEGLFTFKIGHTFYTDDYVNAYVYVDNNGVKYTNIDEFHVINPGLISKESVKLIDFLRFDLIKDGYQPNTSYLVAKDVNGGRNIGLNEVIDVEEDKHYNFKIHDVLSGKDYTVEFMKAKPVEVTTASYLDVPGTHWAFYSIKSLTLSEFINGYPDKTFKPSANITVREFSTILSRYLSRLDKQDLRPVVENYYIHGTTDWGFIETKTVLSTIPRYKMSSFNIASVDRPISREEVAFLIANNLELDVKQVVRTPIDSMSSKYPVEVLSLIASGVMEGYPDNTFKPNLNITRAEIATIFDRLLNPEETE